jgi:hypothetical protein
LESAFRKISRVRSLTGSTQWYLSKDCLLSAKLIMYAVEYRRFYLRDLESVIVWPSRLWLLRLIIPGAVLVSLGGWLWNSVDSTAGEVVVALGVAWLVLELALGPTAKSRIRTTGLSVDFPLVTRARRAPKVLAKIDAAVRASRVVNEQPSPSGIVSRPAEPFIAPVSETNAS